MGTTRTARVALLTAPRTIEVRELPLPEIGDDDGLLRVEACGLCGTDHEQFTGALPAPMPLIPGHETVGTIEEIGSRAAEKWGVAAGDLVAVMVYKGCRECVACRERDFRECERHGLRDMYGFTSVDKSPGLWGGYSEYHYLAPDSVLLKIPAGIPPEVATLFNPLGAGIRWARKMPATAAGDVVAIMGPGIRGLAAASAVREIGAGFVMVTGYGPGDSDRLRIASELFGADLVVDSAESSPVEALKTATGGLADVVVDVTARAPAALAQGIALARPGGKLVIAGTRGSADTPGFWPDLLVYRELTIMGALGVDTESYVEAIEILESGKFGFAELPRIVAPLEGVADLLLTMAGEGDAPPPVHGVVGPAS